MINFILGTLFGGFIVLFCMALITVSKKADCAECEDYKKHFFEVLDSIRIIIQKFYSNELSADNAINQIEKELRL